MLHLNAEILPRAAPDVNRLARPATLIVTMTSCATCGRAWPAKYRVCPDDGTALVASERASADMTARSDGALALQAAPDEELAPGTFAGDYQIDLKIGEGGMGTVYGAHHALIGKR